MKITLFSLVLLATLALVGCTDADLIREAHPTTLAGTAWRVVAINGRPPVAGSEPTAVFGAADVKGSAGCNTYGGAYAYDATNGRIAFQNLAMTAMGCVEPGRGEVEAMFTKAINAATSASMDPQGRLVLSGPGGEIVLTVAAIPL